MNHLDTARLGLNGLTIKTDEVAADLTYIGKYNSTGSLADTSRPGRVIQRVQKVGTVTTIDFPMNATSDGYQEGGHIRDDRATLNRQ